jgi:hypothetical protein
MGGVAPKSDGSLAKSLKIGQDDLKPTDAHHASLALLKSLAEASAVFVAFTFIGGWSYLASYYSTFGLNALEIDVPVSVVCTTAIYVLYSAKWPLVIVAGLTLGWAGFGRRLPALQSSGAAATLALLLLTVSTAGVIEGRRRAGQDSLSSSDELPYVAFASKSPSADQPPCVEFQAFGSFDCKLLLHSKAAYYFFEPVPETGVGSLNVYILSDSDISGAHILRGLERNSRAK